MKVTALVSLLIIGVCIALVARLSMASDIYRSGDFDRAHVEMTSCMGDAIVKRHLKKLQSYIIVDATLSGAFSSSTNGFTWTITTKPTGPNSSHVEFRNMDATAEDIQGVWRVIEWCGKQ